MEKAKTLGDLIRLARTSQGLTQQQLAKLARTTKSAISRIESPAYPFSVKLKTLAAIAKALGLPLSLSLGEVTLRLAPKKQAKSV